MEYYYDNYYLDDTVDDSVENTDYTETNEESYLNILEINDSINELLDEYRQIEPRLLSVYVSDLYYGKGYYRKIQDDEYILEFISRLMNLVESIKNSKRIKNKSTSVRDEDEYEFDTLCSMNSKKIYAQISFRIEYCL